MNTESRVVHINIILRFKTVKKGHLSVPPLTLKSDQKRSKKTKLNGCKQIWFRYLQLDPWPQI